MKTIRDIPILPGGGWGGHAGEFRRSPGALLLRAAHEGGDLCAIRFFNVPILVISSPELLHEALVERARSMVKSLATRIMFYPFAGTGLFTAEGDLWRRQRRLMAPLFNPAAVRGYAPQMNAVITQRLDGWRDGDVIDIGVEMTCITMGVVGKVLFDADRLDEAEAVSSAVRTMFEHLNDESGSLSIVVRATLARLLLSPERMERLPPLLGKLRDAAVIRLSNLVPLPTAKRRRVLEAIDVIDATVHRMIRDRRARGADPTRDDLLSRLLAARDEDGSSMSDRQLRDESVTLFIAGHETTATGLTWALHFLSQNPDAYRRWKNEVAGLEGRMPAAADAARLTYTRGVFKEAIRMYPPVFAFDRIFDEETTLGGYHLPARTPLIVAPYALHRRPDLYPDPERFDPGRFSPEAEAARPRGAYIPFGLGPRVCIGAAFAQLEADLLLAQVAQRFELEAVDSAPVGVSFVAALRPDRPVRLRIHCRRPHRG
jgi:cytochrome P450